MAADKVTPEAVNFMARHGRGLICVPMLGRPPRRAPDRHDGVGQHRPAGHGLHRERGRPSGRHHGHLRVRPRGHDPHARRSGHACPKTSRGPAISSRCERCRAASCAGPGIPRPPSIWRDWPGTRPPASSARCWTRTAAWRACPSSSPWRERTGSRPSRSRPHRVPDPEREARAARGDDAAAHGLRRVHRDRLRDDGRRGGAPRARPGRRGGRCADPRARAFRVPARGRVRLPSLRLRLAAAQGARHHPARGPRHPGLHAPGRPRHRPPEQAQGLRAAGSRHGHRRGQPCPRLSRGSSSLRDRRADPRGPGREEPPDPHQQPEEDRGHRGLRPARASSVCRSRSRPPTPTGGT